MKPESIIEAVRHVRAPGPAWFKCYPSIVGHVEIAIRFRTPSGDEGGFEKQIAYAYVNEGEVLEACRQLWLSAAAVMFDDRNRTFAGQQFFTRPIFTRLEPPEGVNVRIG